MKQIMLNADLGEGFGKWQFDHDADIMGLIDQANIACGFHAGDPVVMQSTIAYAKQYHVAIGAHPSYPDLQGFGRRSMRIPDDELIAILQFQISSLDGMAQCQQTSVSYVKPHGALYNDMMQNDEILHTVMRAVAEYHKPLKLMLQATTDMQAHKQLAEQYGLSLLFEGFADRAYTSAGRLVPRSQAGALLNPEQSEMQAQAFINNQPIKSIDGEELALSIDTLCMHGDSPQALQLASTIRKMLTSA